MGAEQKVRKANLTKVVKAMLNVARFVLVACKYLMQTVQT